MAVNTAIRKLSEAELNDPDLDDDGELDVERYPLPDAGDVEDPYLAEVWEAATELLRQEGGSTGGAEGGDEDEPDVAEKGFLKSSFFETCDRDESGHCVAGSGGAASRAGQAAGRAMHAAGEIEHKVKEAVGERFDKLPSPVKKAVLTTLKVAFAPFTAGQVLAERVAKERGLTDDQAASLRSALATVDLLAFKASKGAALSGVPGAGTATMVSGMVPVASVGYLAYSTAADPLATWRAAKGLAKDAVAAVKSRLARKPSQSGQRNPVYRPSVEQVGRSFTKGEAMSEQGEDVADTVASEQDAALLADALAAHEGDDWYLASLTAALEEANGDVAVAVEAADSMQVQGPPQSDAVAEDKSCCVIPKNRLRKGWITIGGSPGEAGENEGGTHVFVDGSGKITAGPAALTGKPINRLDQGKLKPGEKPKPPKPSPKRPKKPAAEAENPKPEATEPAAAKPTANEDRSSREAAAADYKKNGTKARAFKEWFGDWESDPKNASKIVDLDTGEPDKCKPIKVFHGTRREFDEFDPEKIGSAFDPGDWGAGFYFTSSRSMAEMYAEGNTLRPGGTEGKGRVLETYLSIKNPLSMSMSGDMTELEADSPFIKLLTKTQGKKKVQQWIAEDKSVIDVIKRELGSKEFTKLCQDNGYDGIVQMREDGKTYHQIVAFDPKQIKLVENEGTFDPRSPKLAKGRAKEARVADVVAKSSPDQVLAAMNQIGHGADKFTALSALGQHLGGSPAALHAAVMDLWRAGKITVARPEGRMGTTPEERRWWLHAQGEDLGYVMLRN